MTALSIATKRCAKCCETKPLSEFHRSRSRDDGLSPECKPCANARARTAIARRRQRMGDAAYLAERRETVRRSRQNPDVVARDRAASKAYNAALFALRDAHRREFDALLARERYDRGLDKETN